jgi:hypothetical protein
MTNANLLARFFCAITASALIAGCATNPVERRNEIQRAKSVTVVCCDATSPAAVVSGTAIYGGALLGLGGGVLGAIATRGALGGSKDSRTTTFLQRANKTELPLASDFISTVSDELRARGYEVRTLSARGYDGYSARYPTAPGEVTSQLVLEIRHAAHIAEHYERFLPTIAANYSVRRASDYSVLNFGYVATRDATIKAPPFGDANVVRAPILNVMGPVAAAFRVAEFVTLEEAQLVHGSDAALFENAARMYEATLRANRDAAKLLVAKIDQVRD